MDVDLELPNRNRPDSIELRLRVPDGWKVDSVLQGDRKLKVDEQGTIDCSGLLGSVKLKAKVSQL